MFKLFETKKKPEITQIVPSHGTNGTEVQISGHHFCSSPKINVAIGDSVCANVSTDCTDSEHEDHVNCTVTQSEKQIFWEPQPVIITNVAGESNKDTQFTFAYAPIVKSIFPDHGSENGGTIVRIEGKYFIEIVSVSIGEKAPCKLIGKYNSTVLECITSAKSGQSSGAVIVQTELGGYSDADQAVTFKYRPAPVISSFAPSFGPLSGGTMVVINGENLGETATDLVSVSLSNVYCTNISWTNTKLISCISAPHPDPFNFNSSMAAYVNVTTDSGGMGTSYRVAEAPVKLSKSSLFWNYTESPLVDSVQPSHSRAVESSQILIYSKNLLWQFGKNFTQHDLVSISVAGQKCFDSKMHNNGSISCSVGPVSKTGIVEGEIILETISGGLGSLFRKETEHNAKFTFYPRPLLSRLVHDPHIYCTYPNNKFQLYGQFLSNIGNPGQSDFESLTFDDVPISKYRITLMNQTYLEGYLPQFPANKFIREGKTALVTKSGGSGELENAFTCKAVCSKIAGIDDCQRNGCFWCASSSVCLEDLKSCPALCVIHGNEADCSAAGLGCSWCPSTTTCLDRKGDCPQSCFLYRDRYSCEEVGKSDHCKWCFATSTCLETQRMDRKSQTPVLITEFSCPTSCSLDFRTDFSCGSTILLVLILTLILTLIVGFYLVIYFVQRDDQFAKSLKRMAQHSHPANWLQARHRMSTTGRFESLRSRAHGSILNKNEMADETTTLLNSSSYAVPAPRASTSKVKTFEDHSDILIL